LMIVIYLTQASRDSIKSNNQRKIFMLEFNHSSDQRCNSTHNFS
jgi:hypothetical protein